MRDQTLSIMKCETKNRSMIKDELQASACYNIFPSDSISDVFLVFNFLSFPLWTFELKTKPYSRSLQGSIIISSFFSTLPPACHLLWQQLAAVLRDRVRTRCSPVDVSRRVAPCRRYSGLFSLCGGCPPVCLSAALRPLLPRVSFNTAFL